MMLKIVLSAINILTKSLRTLVRIRRGNLQVDNL